LPLKTIVAGSAFTFGGGEFVAVLAP